MEYKEVVIMSYDIKELINRLRKGVKEMNDIMDKVDVNSMPESEISDSINDVICELDEMGNEIDKYLTEIEG